MKRVSRPSPNFNERAGVSRADILVLHYTGMVSAEAALTRLTDPIARVSSHYTIDEDGTVYEHVPVDKRAWHAGVSSWRGESDINSRSVGIEIVNPGHEFGYRPFPTVQIASVVEVSLDLIRALKFPARNVVAHSDIAPDRKEDPGELFPWSYLAERGIGLWPVRSAARAIEGSSAADINSIQSKLRRFGYGVTETGIYDEATRVTICAFQRRFRTERIDGVWDLACDMRLDELISLLDGPDANDQVLA